MRISEMVKKLQDCQAECGDLDVVTPVWTDFGHGDMGWDNNNQSKVYLVTGSPSVVQIS